MCTDSLLILPLDILINIFTKLRLSDLRNVMLTCKTLCDIIKHDNRIWRSFSKKSIILQDNKENRWLNELSWYDRCRISHNWKIGCYMSKTLICHHTNYMPWLKLHDSEVLLLTVGSEVVCYQTDNKGTPNCSKPFWKVDVPKIIRQDERTNDVSRFVTKNNILVCGNRDGCVAVYKNNSIQNKPQLECHIKDCLEDGQVEVSAVEFINSRDQLSILAVSTRSPVMLLHSLRNNEDIVIPNNKNNMCYITLEDCIGGKCLSLNKMEDKLAIGLNGNSRPLLFDVNTNQFLMTARATEHRWESTYDIQWHNENTIVFVNHFGYLMLLDTRIHKVAAHDSIELEDEPMTNDEYSSSSVIEIVLESFLREPRLQRNAYNFEYWFSSPYKVYSVKDPFHSTLHCVKTDSDNGIIVGSDEDSRCVLFDARQTPHHVQMYYTQRNSSPVYCLDFDSTQLITAVDRGVAVLNFNIDSNSNGRRDYSERVVHYN